LKKRAEARFLLFMFLRNRTEVEKKPVGNSQKTRRAPAESPGLNRSKRIAQQVFQIAEPLCASEDVELVFVEYHSESGGKVLRITIDKPDGITLDDCARISRQLNDLLDVELGDVGAYNLEVSSPGPERPIGKRSDFDRFRGKKVKIQTTQPIDGQKNFTGLLKGIIDERVTLTIDDKTVAIPFAAINKARLVDHGDCRCTCQT
jgi:ribosome maturation factor RimP